MAYQLYPPSISGTLPAIQLISQSTTNKIVRVYQFEIPFTMNRGVGWNQISGFMIKIKNKTLQSISMLPIPITTQSVIDYAKQTGIVKFEVEVSSTSKIDIVPEEYYKVQMAFIDLNGENGYFSTVGYAKCIDANGISITINNQNNNQTLEAIGQYKATYQQLNFNYVLANGGYTSIKNTEAPYSFTYAIVHTHNNIGKNNVLTQGWSSLNAEGVYVDYLSKEILHSDIMNDLSDTFEYWIDLPTFLDGNNRTNWYDCFLLFRLRTTNNGYFENIHPLTQSYLNPEVDKVSLTVKNNYEDAFVDLTIDGSGYTSVEYTLLRAEANKLPYQWLKLGTVTLGSTESIATYQYRDFLVEHGQTYVYALSYVAENNANNYRLVSDPIQVSFEDMFLLDSNGRQLRVQYNPKVSTFKQDILEQKVDTIGGQYPFFFRNGRVKYKEFALSGLISYLIDSNELFLNDEDLGLIKNFAHRDSTMPHWPEEIRTVDEETGEVTISYTAYENDIEDIPYLDRRTNLDDKNMFAERVFKRTVQDWLGNGEVKLLKTPAEGTFLVRLMNITLAPEDRLSRMLHTFSCQAYEVENTDYQGFYKLGFITDSLEHKGFGWSSTLIPRPLPANKTVLENLETQDIATFESAGSTVYLGIDNGQFVKVPAAN